MQIFSGKNSTHILKVEKSQNESKFKVELQKDNKSAVDKNENNISNTTSNPVRLLLVIQKFRNYFKKSKDETLNNSLENKIQSAAFYRWKNFCRRFWLDRLRFLSGQKYTNKKNRYEFKKILENEVIENKIEKNDFLNDKIKQYGLSKKEHIENLAFFPFFRFVLKASYLIGWLFLFSVRLIYFLLKMTLSGSGGYTKYLLGEYGEYKKYKEQTKKEEMNLLEQGGQTEETPKNIFLKQEMEVVDLNTKYNVNKNKSYAAPVSFVINPPKSHTSKIARQKISLKINLPKILKLRFRVKKSADKLVKDKKNNKKTKKALNILKKEKKRFTKKEQDSMSLFNRGYLKHAIVYMLILFAVIIPLKAFVYYKDYSSGEIEGRVLGATEEAFSNLKDATKSAGDLNFDLASQNFAEASKNFSDVKNELNRIDDLLFSLASLVPDSKLKIASEAKEIVLAGQISSEMGEDLSLAVNSFFTFKEVGLLEVLKKFSFYTRKAVNKNDGLIKVLKGINPDNIPEKYRESFKKISEKTEFFGGSLSEIVEIVDKAIIFLGDSKDTRYLLVFQNNTELRASGGFVGSYALVDFSDGKIKNLEVPGGGSYDTEAGMFSRIRAPEPMQLVTTQWFFWDSNWWPDWEKSAKKLAWFLEKSNGPTVDGVISLTPTVVEKLLGVVGAIDMTEEYGVVVNANNFWKIVQSEAEQKQDITKTPKKVIGDLMFKIIEELPKRLNQDMLIEMLKIINDSFTEKHLLFYLADPVLNKKIEELGWDGKIKDSLYDYLMVVNTNIAGGKSDKVIRDFISHKTEILDDGSIVVDLEVSRTHTGNNREGFAGVRNNSWLRVYVPRGSKLISAKGFTPIDSEYFEIPDNDLIQDELLKNEENDSIVDKPSGTKIYIESNKTVFANWLSVDPGEKAIVRLKYRLPFKFQPKKTEVDNKFYSLVDKTIELLNPESKELTAYSLMIQKQPGTKNISFESKLSIKPSYNLAWKYPAGVNAYGDGWQVDDKLNRDKYFAIILEKKKE